MPAPRRCWAHRLPEGGSAASRGRIFPLMNWTLPGWAAKDTDTAWHLGVRRLAWIGGGGGATVRAGVVGPTIAARLSPHTLTLLPQAPGATQLRQVQLARPSVLLSADGQPLASFS